MRLTSYNVAVKALNAGSCLSQIVGYMWDFEEQGDVKHAQCAREKALLLDALICALKRWKPTIDNAYYYTYTSTYVSGDYAIPIQLFSLSANGINLMSTEPIIEVGGYVEVHDALAYAVNTAISKNDDIISVDITKLNDDVYLAEVLFDAEYFGSTTITGGSGILKSVPSVPVPVTTSTSTTSVSSPQSVKGLTNDEVYAIIKKIDEICENL